MPRVVNTAVLGWGAGRDVPLQVDPPRHRMWVVDGAWRRLEPGGCFADASSCRHVCGGGAPALHCCVAIQTCGWLPGVRLAAMVTAERAISNVPTYTARAGTLGPHAHPRMQAAIPHTPHQWQQRRSAFLQGSLRWPPGCRSTTRAVRVLVAAVRAKGQGFVLAHWRGALLEVEKAAWSLGCHTVGLGVVRCAIKAGRVAVWL